MFNILYYRIDMHRIRKERRERLPALHCLPLHFRPTPKPTEIDIRRPIHVNLLLTVQQVLSVPLLTDWF